MIQIVISNQSTLVSPEDLANWLPDLQTQIHRDFFPAWGIDATLTMSAAREAGAYRVILKDDADDPSALGFHLVNGVPEARIFCRPTIADGDTVSGVLSHELLEMLADPDCTRMEGQFIIECADPVEQTGYMIGNTYVSNFVLPVYFRYNATGQTSGFDFRGLLTAGCPAMLPGGYIMRYADGQWQSTFARRADGTIPYQAIKQSGRSAFRASLGAPKP
jgi:hypothetical protein